jgi:molecular chaperone HtpG
LVASLSEFKGKRLKAVDKGELTSAEIDPAKKERFAAFLTFLKEKLSDIKEARLSNRLKESAVCLVSDDWAMGAHMERIMQRMGKGGEVPAAQRILEVNPDHPTIDALQKLHARSAADARLESYVRILYDEALLAEGSRLKDPATFAQRINELLAKDAEN